MSTKSHVYMKSARCAVAFALIMAGVLLAGCEETKKAKPPEPVSVIVKVIEPIPSLPDAFTLHAKVEPSRVANISAEVAGRVEEICCQEGEWVKNGSGMNPLIKLNTDLLQAQYDQAKAQADFDTLDLKRIKTLFDRQVATANEYDAARTKAAASKAMLDLHKAQLDRATIYTPIDGILNSVPVEVGEYVQPGQMIAEIVDSKTVKIVANVPENDVQYLKVGDKVVIEYTYRGVSRSREVKISQISELAHPRSLTTRVEMDVANSTGEFFSGQVMKVRFVRRVLTDAIMVPMASVIPLERDKVVFVENNGKALRRKVEIGFIKGHDVQITSGLKAGDRLIVKGHRYVSQDQEVQVASIVGQGSQDRSPVAASKTEKKNESN